MQNLLMLAPAVANTQSFGSSAGDGRIGVIDARDVGAVAAQIARSPATHSNRTYWPSGPVAITYADAAGILSEILGRPIAYHPLTVEEQTQVMVDAGLPDTLAAMNAQALALFADGDSDWITNDVPAILGRPATTFAQFANDHASAFS